MGCGPHQDAIRWCLLSPWEHPQIKTPITVRIETGLLAEMRQRAREENRTLTNFIETVLRQRISGPPPHSPASVQRNSAQTSRPKDKPTHAL
ncbi:hypothetical protein D9599_28540 [Roseomonas sp. KE2513]|nr:hypothetical protein [Roseomonas sp. KE2513]